MLPEKEVTNVEERDVCENASILVLRDAYNILSLMPEQLYRLQIDRKIGDGNIVDANFTYNGKPVEKLKRVKDCEHQPKRIVSFYIFCHDQAMTVKILSARNLSLIF